MDMVSFVGACFLPAFCNVLLLLSYLPTRSSEPNIFAKNRVKPPAQRNNTRRGGLARMPLLYANHKSHESVGHTKQKVKDCLLPRFG